MIAEERGELLRTFRSPELRGGFGSRAGLGLVLVAAALTVLAIGTESPLLAVVVAVSLVVAWQSIRNLVGRACLEAYEKGVLVLNPLSSVWVPWEEITDVSGAGRLRIERRDGAALLVYAVGNSNFGWLTGREGYADEVARVLVELKELHSP